MKNALRTLGIAVGVMSLVVTGSLGAAEPKAAVSGGGQKVTLMLGGKFCDSYPEDVERALKNVSGVKAVDLKSMPGHAVVEVEPGKAKPEQLVAAVDTVKGSGWHCKAQVMK